MRKQVKIHFHSVSLSRSNLCQLRRRHFPSFLSLCSSKMGDILHLSLSRSVYGSRSLSLSFSFCFSFLL